MKGFKKCCISNGMEETDDDVLWNGNEQYGDVRSECEGDWSKRIESDKLCVLSVCNL